MLLRISGNSGRRVVKIILIFCLNLECNKVHQFNALRQMTEGLVKIITGDQTGTLFFK